MMPPRHEARPATATNGTPPAAPGTSEDLPPAYVPPGVQTRLQAQLAAAVQVSDPGLANYIRTLPMAAPTAVREPSPDPDEEPYEQLSPIRLRISARVNVARDNNIIILPDSPAQQANSIAEAVVRAFKSSSVAEGGIPMIDQDGRPRPVKIEADAGITVEGVNNVVGPHEAVMDVMRLRHSGSTT